MSTAKDELAPNGAFVVFGLNYPAISTELFARNALTNQAPRCILLDMKNIEFDGCDFNALTEGAREFIACLDRQVQACNAGPCEGTLRVTLMRDPSAPLLWSVWTTGDDPDIIGAGRDAADAIDEAGVALQHAFGIRWA